MVVINAEINGTPSLSGHTVAKLKDFCKKVNIFHFGNVYTIEVLAAKLEFNKHHNIILFSNFPPDSSYPESGKKTGVKMVNNIKCRSIEADSYSKSTSLFKDLLNKYNFKSIHFITGAPEDMVSSQQLLSLSESAISTVTRKADWIHPDLDYEQMFYLYLTRKIKETVAGG